MPGVISLRDGSTSGDVRLDRLVQFDERSRDYPVRQLVAEKRPRSYTWRVGGTYPGDVFLDQGHQGSCVGHAFAHELVARPLQATRIDGRYARERLYWEAQKIDPWQGGAYPGAVPRYEGTSVLAGAKVCRSLGHFAEYRWAFSLHDLVLALGYTGPAVLGVWWWSGMFAPDPQGFIHPRGEKMGGHAILAYRVRLVPLRPGPGWSEWRWDNIDLDHSHVGLWNSWGCYSEDTEILTSTGWKSFGHLVPSEAVATLNPDTHEIEYQEVTQLHRYPYDGELWRFQCQGVDLLVTPNHSLYVGSQERSWWKLIAAEDLPLRHFRMKKDGRWVGEEQITYLVNGAVPVAMDDWLEFLGYWISEGHACDSIYERAGRFRDNGWEGPSRQHSYAVGVSQSKADHLATMQACLDRLPFSFTRISSGWSAHRRDLYEELAPLGRQPERRLPRWVFGLSPRQLRILLDAMMRGDGTRGVQEVYYTSSPGLADDVQELALLAGMAADVASVDRRGRRNNRGTTRHVEYQVSLKQTRMTPKKQGGWDPIPVAYNGGVVCVTVPNHIVYVRRNGKAVWSGNSAWGQRGTAKITLRELGSLLDDRGEACIMVGRQKVA